MSSNQSQGRDFQPSDAMQTLANLLGVIPSHTPLSVNRNILTQKPNSPIYLMHQPSDASGNALQSTTTYPTATPKIDSLGNTELILPKGNRLQRGAQGLANVANTLKSGLNTFVAQPLANAATYISQSSPRRQENPKVWLGKTGIISMIK